MSTPKKGKIPDLPNEPSDSNLGDKLWDLPNICASTCIVDLEGLTFNMDATGATTAGTYTPAKTEHEQVIEALLTDIWHNQATMIKWLSKIAENTKHTGKCTLED